MSFPLRSRTILAASTALVLGLALACGPSDRRAQVVYYYQAGSEAAARQTPALRALETEFAGKVVVKIIDASTPEAKKDVTRLGWPSHGVLVRDYRGIMLFRQSGDDFEIDEIRSTLRQVAPAQ
jgi:hypothetical protein